jgi:hypothetical protein
MKTTLAVLLVLVPPLTAACDRDAYPPVSAPMTTSGVLAAGPVSARDVDALTEERCDLEDRCANIGVGGDYATLEDCVEQVGSDNASALTDAACPGGIDPGRLQTCLVDIHREHCDDLFGTLRSYTACTQSVLCPSWETAVGGYIGGS